MKIFCVLLPVFAVLGASAALAQNNAPLPGEWVREVESGRVDILERKLPCTVNSFSATLRLRNPRRVGGFSPALKVALNLAPAGARVESARRTLTVAVDEQHYENNLVGYVTTGIGRDTLLDALAVPARFHFGDEIPLKLTWRADGVVFIDIGGQKLVRAIGQLPETINLVVGSASGEFRDIRTGWVPSAEYPAPKCS
jgi:hypothetical protein